MKSIGPTEQSFIALQNALFRAEELWMKATNILVVTLAYGSDTGRYELEKSAQPSSPNQRHLPAVGSLADPSPYLEAHVPLVPSNLVEVYLSLPCHRTSDSHPLDKTIAVIICYGIQNT